MDEQDSRTDMPAHERDPDDAVGGGVMGSGGTAVDRGTGERTTRTDDPGDVLDDGLIAGPPAGGAQPYIPAVTDDDEDGGVPEA
jgi:hypothetical protein